MPDASVSRAAVNEAGCHAAGGASDRFGVAAKRYTIPEAAAFADEVVKPEGLFRLKGWGLEGGGIISLEYFRGSHQPRRLSASWLEPYVVAGGAAVLASQDLATSIHAVKTAWATCTYPSDSKPTQRMHSSAEQTHGAFLALSSPHVTNSPIPALLERSNGARTSRESRHHLG